LFSQHTDREAHSRLFLLAPVLLPVSLCVLALALGCSEEPAAQGQVAQRPAEAAEAPQQRAEAPLFALPDLQDTEVRLEEVLADKPALLVFWATWCTYCRAEIPDLNRLQAERGDEVSLLAIDIQESRRKVSAFADKEGIAYRILLDSDAQVARRYGITGIPSLILIDRQGGIHYQGHVVEEAEAKLSELLGEDAG
jgi:thiol-disulfide isomerase/thioredoxin